MASAAFCQPRDPCTSRVRRGSQHTPLFSLIDGQKWYRNQPSRRCSETAKLERNFKTVWTRSSVGTVSGGPQMSFYELLVQSSSSSQKVLIKPASVYLDLEGIVFGFFSPRTSSCDFTQSSERFPNAVIRVNVTQTSKQTTK